MRLYQRFTLWEYKNALAWNQVIVPLSYQCAKDPLRSIPTDRIAKALPDNNSYATRRVIQLIRQQIEACRRNPLPMPLDGLYVPAGP